MASQERGSYTDRIKETAKKGGIAAGIAGGVLFLVSGSGLGLALMVGGGGTYGGVKYLENRGGKK